MKFRGKTPAISSAVLIDESAVIIGNVRVGSGSSIWPGAVLRGDMNYVRVGKNVSVQDNAVLHGTADKFPTIVGDNVTIGHGAIVHGCRIGDNCLIGMGAIILEGAKVGNWCIVAAGCVVPEGMVIPSNSLAIGVPAKIRGRLTAEQKRRITLNWKAYVKLSEEYTRIH